MCSIKYVKIAIAVILISYLVSPGTNPALAGSDDLKIKGNLQVAGEISGIGMVPPGGIVMFYGEAGKAFDADGTGIKGTPYEGWQLCNGQKQSPDLRNRFIVAAGESYKIGDQGGSDSVQLTVNQIPAHSHTGNTSVSGNHQHWIEGTDAKGLAKRRRTIPGQTTVDMGWGGGSNADPNNVQWRGHVNTNTVGNHGHNLSIGNTGGSQPHENRPRFYSLAFIMRLPLTSGN